MATTTRKRKASKTRRKARRTAQLLQDNAGSALRRGRETISRAYGWAQHAAEGAHLGNIQMPRTRDIKHFAEANPLLLGAVGLGLGVAIGTLFPRGMRSMTATRRSPAASSRSAKSRRRRKKDDTAATG